MAESASEDKITADGIPHSKLKQPVCPWCGMDLRCGSGWHVEGFAEHGLCGSKWFPDSEGGHLEGREQSTACKEIARLQAQLSEAQVKRDTWETLARKWLHEINREPVLDDVRKFNAHVRVPGCVGIEHAHPGEYWIDLDMMADRIRAIKGLEIVPASRVLKDGEVAVQREYFEALENGDDVIRPYSVWLHDVFALRAQGKEGA